MSKKEKNFVNEKTKNKKTKKIPIFRIISLFIITLCVIYILLFGIEKITKQKK